MQRRFEGWTPPRPWWSGFAGGSHVRTDGQIAGGSREIPARSSSRSKSRRDRHAVAHPLQYTTCRGRPRSRATNEQRVAAFGGSNSLASARKSKQVLGDSSKSEPVLGVPACSFFVHRAHGPSAGIPASMEHRPIRRGTSAHLPAIPPRTAWARPREAGHVDATSLSAVISRGRVTQRPDATLSPSMRHADLA